MKDTNNPGKLNKLKKLFNVGKTFDNSNLSELSKHTIHTITNQDSFHYKAGGKIVVAINGHTSDLITIYKNEKFANILN